MASTSRNAFKIEHSETSENKEPKAVWNLVAVFFNPRIPGFRSSQGHGQEDAPVGRWSREWLGLGHGMNPRTKWGFAGKSMVNLFGEDDGRCSTPYRVSIDSILWILFPPIFSGWCFQQTASDLVVAIPIGADFYHGVRPAGCSGAARELCEQWMEVVGSHVSCWVKGHVRVVWYFCPWVTWELSVAMMKSVSLDLPERNAQSRLQFLSTSCPVNAVNVQKSLPQLPRSSWVPKLQLALPESQISQHEDAGSRCKQGIGARKGQNCWEQTIIYASCWDMNEICWDHLSSRSFIDHRIIWS